MLDVFEETAVDKQAINLAEAGQVVFAPQIEQRREALKQSSLHRLFLQLALHPELIDCMPDLSDTQNDSDDLLQWMSTVGADIPTRRLLDTSISSIQLEGLDILSSHTLSFLLPSIDGMVSIREVLVAMQITFDENKWIQHYLRQTNHHMRARAERLHRPELCPQDECIVLVRYSQNPPFGGAYRGKYKGKSIIELTSPLKIDLGQRDRLRNFYRGAEEQTILSQMRTAVGAKKTVSHERYHEAQAKIIEEAGFILYTLERRARERGLPDNLDPHALITALFSSFEGRQKDYVPTLFDVVCEGFARWNDIQLLMEDLEAARRTGDHEREACIIKVIEATTKKQDGIEFDPYFDGYHLMLAISPDGDPGPILVFIKKVNYYLCQGVRMDTPEYTATMDMLKKTSFTEEA